MCKRGLKIMNILLLLVGAFSGLSHSIYSAVSKSLLKHRISEPLLFFLYISIFQAATTPLLWFFIRPAIPPITAWTPLLLAGITGVIAFLFLYKALSSGDASSVMPIMGSKVIFAGFLAIFMLNEKHHWTIYFAAILVAISIGILGYSPSPGKKSRFSGRPVFLMILCSIVFAFTDNYITRCLRYIDSYNFMVYYNLIIGVGSLAVIPYIKRKKISLLLPRKVVWWVLISAVFLVTATLLLTISFKMANGVVIPNILVSTRGVFIVIISAVLTQRGSSLLETQTSGIYLLRFIASALIVVSIWIALQ